ncbi:MAG: cell surface protein SprA [Flavobacteriaceae bacterium]|nr:cell surface protein SprA [Flavobacteriaceae bacterium]
MNVRNTTKLWWAAAGVAVASFMWASPGARFYSLNKKDLAPAKVDTDTPVTKVVVPWKTGKSRSPFILKTPQTIGPTYELDSSGKFYVKRDKVGNTTLGSPEEVGLKDYQKQKGKEQDKEYFQKRAKAQNFVQGGGIIPSLKLPDNDLVKSLVGNGKVEIKPTGSAELTFGGNYNVIRNPSFSARQQRNFQPVFNQTIRLNVTGSIGDKFKIGTNYNTDAVFDFENQLKLDWSGKDDDIVKKVEVGNVSLPLNGTLIQGSQALFGAKVKLQFGRLTATVIGSQQKGKAQEVELQGGAQVTPFDIQCDKYEENRHYFLGQYFRDNYEQWLATPGIPGSPIQIKNIEVWVTNRTGAFNDARDVIGFMDLGESSKYIWNKSISGVPSIFYPNNAANSLYSTLERGPYRSSFQVIQNLEQLQPQMKQIEDYQLANFARMLNKGSEYTLNERLGYISLNQKLNSDEVLMVAYEYTWNGIPQQVGEFSVNKPTNAQNPNVLFLKMLKPVSIRPDLPSWKLMMKNIYSMEGYSISPKDFKLQVIYADDPSGADLPYLPAKDEPIYGKNLLQVMKLDRMNIQNEPTPDGQFDWIEGLSVQAQQGRIIFPMLEPFGKFIRSKFNDPSGLTADYYAFDALYDSTRWAAQQQALKNKYFLRGSFQGSATNEISLNALNIPKGSVKVTYNGSPLQEGSDYTVDYTQGKVRITNPGMLNSGGSIKATFESSTTFSIQQKTLYGTRLDYKISDDFLLGGTALHLKERPLTPKVNLGDEPLSNSIIGFDGTYKKDSRALTKLIDRLPFISTKEMSNILITGEFAKIIPGVAPAIRKILDKKGVSYLDDFEAAETPYDLRIGGNYWQLASTPQGQPDIFPDGTDRNTLGFRHHNARLAWYMLDPLFFRNDNLTPAHIKADVLQQSNHYVREVRSMEVFPNKQVQQGYPQTLQTFDLAYFPNQRGFYNFRTDKLNTNGTFQDPTNSWAGVMRKIETNDFEQANIDYVELWLMDPFVKGHNPNPNNSGQVYLHLGNVSEDVLRDSRKAFENGLPKSRAANTSLIDTTIWSQVPGIPAINNAFDNDPNSRNLQDVGYDGFDDQSERVFNKNYLADLKTLYGANSEVYLEAEADPSSDNYHYYRGSDYDGQKRSIIYRQKRLNGSDGNSPSPNAAPQHQPKEAYPVGITNVPNDEDINKDFTLNEIEEYYQYRIDLSRDRLRVGQNYVTDSNRTVVALRDGSNDTVTWYQFKIPIRSYERRIGQIPDFKSIRFMRVIASGFTDSLVMRFGAMQLVRADWRKYLFSLLAPGDVTPVDPTDETRFIVSTVNIEKNGKRRPIPYVLPPGIIRTIDASQPNPIQNNEQSLSLQVCGLKDGDARAAFKNTKFDIRNFKNLKMFVHCEAAVDDSLKDGELSAFLRLGTDFTNNYYEIEIPLHVTRKDDISDYGIWPTVNELDVALDDFYNLKLDRFRQNLGATAYYEKIVNGKRLSVSGIPDMSNLRVFLLGVRNPKKTDATPDDDGMSKCGEVWFNELRAQDFDNPGGWAATGRLVVKLADIGMFNMSGNITTVGYGGCDKKLNERARSLTTNFDVNTSLELGKLFPAKSGISIPFFWGYTQAIVRPQFYPLNPDLKMDSVLKVVTLEEGQIAKFNADDFTSRRSWNLSNVRKAPGKKKPRPWSISNFNLTYSVNELKKRNQTVQYNMEKNYQLLLNYTYQFPNMKPIEPLKKIGKSKYLQLIRDFNFYPLPQSIAINTQTDRRYGEMVFRQNDNLTSLLPVIDTLFNKNFTNRRTYDLKWDLAKSLKASFNAIAQTRIEEPAGSIYTYNGEGHDSILKNIKTGGRMTDYNQITNLSYSLPFSKFPLTNWITASTTYQVTYNWKNPLPSMGDTVGNTISNSRNMGLNGQLNFIQLYSKVKFLDKINKGTFAKPEKKGKKPTTPKSKTEEKVSKDGKEAGVEKPDEDEPKEEEPKVNKGKLAIQVFGKFLLMTKNATFSYTQNDGTTLPGFQPKPKYLGQNLEYDAPGFAYIFGSQDDSIKWKAAQSGWLTKDPRLQTNFLQSTSQTMQGSATLEPFTDFRINLTANRTYQNSFQSLFVYDTTAGITDYVDRGGNESGNLSMSYNFLKTAFKFSDTAGSVVFDAMKANRHVISSRLQEIDGRSIGMDLDTPYSTQQYATGLGSLQHDVLLYSFLAAYTGTDASKFNLNAFPRIPLPNWRITYNGLSKFKAVQKYFNSVTLSHNFTSKYTIGGFASSISYNADSMSKAGSYLEPKLRMQSVSITEQFNPLIGIDVSMKSNLTAKLEVNRSRNVVMNLQNPQLIEQQSNEWVFGLGYIKKGGMTIPFIKVQNGRKLVLENDVSFRVDISVRDNWTAVRKLVDLGFNQPTNGSKIISIKPEINYKLSDQMNLRVFYDRKVTKPYTSNTFPTSITQFGATVRYMLQ